jgi:hypothetical protein
LIWLNKLVVTSGAVAFRFEGLMHLDRLPEGRLLKPNPGDQN